MLNNKLNLIKIKKSLLAASQKAAEHLFLTFISLIFIAAVLGFAVFYKYGVMPEKRELELGVGIIKFDENIYQNVLREWQARGERLEAAKIKEYPDLFK